MNMEKLTIKEAGRYANFLDKMIGELVRLPRTGIEASLYKTTEVHKKSESYSEAKDETEVVEYENRVDLTVDELTNLIKTFVEEKSLLANRIAEAKKSIYIESDDTELSLDAAVETAKLYRTISSNYFAILESLKDLKYKDKRMGYAFNVEGNQTSYYYNVEVETELLYDKKAVVKENKQFKALADKLSEKIEQAMSQDLVEVEPKFNYLDTLEEIVEAHTNK